MLGVGYQELFLIGLAALLLFGPGKLPEVMGQAGKWYKQFRDVTSELTGEFEKTVAEAKSEMGDLGLDLGPMQKQVNSITKSVQKDLGGTKTTAKKTTSTGSKAKSSTGTKSTGSKSTSTSTSKTTSSRSTTGTSATRTNTSKPNMTSGKPVVVASKEDPIASISMFEQPERKPKRRARSATPSIITDPTPRDLDIEESEPRMETAKSDIPASLEFDADDPIARARQRRLKAGYAQATA